MALPCRTLAGALSQLRGFSGAQAPRRRARPQAWHQLLLHQRWLSLSAMQTRPHRDAQGLPPCSPPRPRSILILMTAEEARRIAQAAAKRRRARERELFRTPAKLKRIPSRIPLSVMM